MTLKEKAIELLPCPFCGSRDLTLDNLTDPDDWFVSCNGCEIQQIANYTRETAIERWNKRAASLSSWTRTADRLPELSGTYIACFFSGTVGPCHWNASKKIWGESKEGRGWNVTAWQPLPAPPEDKP